MIGRPPRLICLLLGLLALAAPAHAHAIHTSLAEADYNRTSRKLEVALRVFADDFEAILGERAKAPVSLTRTPARELDPLIRAYLAERFVIRDQAGAIITHEWVGRDLKDAANELWLFFECSLPSGPDNATVHHAVLAEKFSDQVNSVQLRDGERRTTIVFLPSHGPKRIRFRP